MIFVALRPLSESHLDKMLTDCPRCGTKRDHAYSRTLEVPMSPREYSDGTVFTKRVVDQYVCAGGCGNKAVDVRQGEYFVSAEDQKPKPSER